MPRKPGYRRSEAMKKRIADRAKIMPLSQMALTDLTDSDKVTPPYKKKALTDKAAPPYKRKRGWLTAPKLCLFLKRH
ncbi:UNVERIFIED_CONTAM: hypothetical protein FKN15_064578 [Acipenser sinensis]